MTIPFFSFFKESKSSEHNIEQKIHMQWLGPITDAAVMDMISLSARTAGSGIRGQYWVDDLKKVPTELHLSTAGDIATSIPKGTLRTFSELPIETPEQYILDHMVRCDRAAGRNKMSSAGDMTKALILNEEGGMYLESRAFRSTESHIKTISDTIKFQQKHWKRDVKASEIYPTKNRKLGKIPGPHKLHSDDGRLLSLNGTGIIPTFGQGNHFNGHNAAACSHSPGTREALQGLAGRAIISTTGVIDKPSKSKKYPGISRSSAMQAASLLHNHLAIKNYPFRAVNELFKKPLESYSDSFGTRYDMERLPTTFQERPYAEMGAKKSLGSQGLMNRTGRVFSDPEKSKDRKGNTIELEDMKKILKAVFNSNHVNLASLRQWTKATPSTESQDDHQVNYGKKNEYT